MIVVVDQDREGARNLWRECAEVLPVEAVKHALAVFPGSAVVSFTLADDEHRIAAPVRIEEPKPRGAEEPARKEWW